MKIRKKRIGESAIPSDNKKIDRVFLAPENPQTTPAVKEAIAGADVIIIGPGSLYTSILPNLLVDGIADSIRESNALKIYICNVMTQAGETDAYTAADHAQAIIEHCGGRYFRLYYPQ